MAQWTERWPEIQRVVGLIPSQEKHQCVVASRMPPTGDPACNPGISRDGESNCRPFGLQASAQSTEPYQPGVNKIKF